MPIELLRKTGFEVLDYVPWGTHCCHFFETQKDLLETLLSFFHVGLKAKEFCLWVAHPPLTEQTVRSAVKKGIPDSDRYLRDGSLEIVSAREWYLRGGTFSVSRVLRAWNEKLGNTSARGYDGMRANGSASWLQKNDWKRFEEYEGALNESLSEKRMVVLCSYPLDKCDAVELLDVARTHQYAIAKRAGKWDVLEWRSPPGPSDPYSHLTTRQRQALLLAAEGLTNPQIAKHLSISVRTVESHRASVMRRLRLRHQTDLVRYALQRGLLPFATQNH